MKKKSILLFLLAMTAGGMYANDGVGTEPDDSIRQQQVNWQEDCGALSANKNDYAGLNALRSRMASATTSDESASDDSLRVSVGVPIYFYFKLNTAGHRPDHPSEVLRKGYGDCKGMALLLRTLLRAEGYDARLADIGTRDITIRMGDYPCLAASNHVICVMRLKGKTYWLDATMEYTPYNYIPQHIQGQQALVEDGDKYTLETVPVLPATTSVDHLSYDYRIGADDSLTGKANYRLSGDMKEYFFSLYGHRKNKDQEGFLADNLNNDDHSNTVTHVTFAGEQPQSEWATFSGDVTNSHALQRLDGELYLEMDPHNNYFTMRIDTTERRQDFMLPVCCNIEREVTVTLPAGARVTFLPQPFIVRLPQGTLSCTFRQSGGKVVFVQQMRISNRRIPLATIPDWNKSLDQWTDACNQQVIIHL